MKICKKCNLKLPPEVFHKHSGTLDGLASNCKACNKVRAKELYKENPERHRRYATESYHRNLEVNRAKSRERAKAIPKEIKNAQARKYRLQNKEHVNEQLKKRRLADPERFKNYKRKAYVNRSEQQKEADKAYRTRYREKNRARKNELSRLYYRRIKPLILRHPKNEVPLEEQIRRKKRRLECARKRYAETPEKQHLRSAEYRSRNREKLLAALRKWAKDNPDKVKAYTKKWYAENRDRSIANSIHWVKENRERFNENNRKRLAVARTEMSDIYIKKLLKDTKSPCRIVKKEHIELKRSILTLKRELSAKGVKRFANCRPQSMS